MRGSYVGEAQHPHRSGASSTSYSFVPATSKSDTVIASLFPSIFTAPKLELLAWVPVVMDLVIVPYHERRDLGVEAADVRVEEVIGEGAAELVERLGDLRFRGRGEVLPEGAVGEADARRDGAVG